MQSNEVANSYGTKLEGLKSFLAFLRQENQLIVSDTITDRHSYAPEYSKNSGKALSVTPVRPVRTSVRPSICPSVRPTFLSGPQLQNLMEYIHETSQVHTSQ